MATASRALWKGAINFGLVHIPVSLHAASRSSGIDFDWLDRRSMDPVGYLRINKRTGKKIESDNIVRGVKWRDGDYVVLSDDEIEEAFPRTTQSIDIEAFVEASEIPFVYLDRPYYLAPTGKGSKVYALLRETLLRAGKVGLARVVISSKQHLAALVASDRALVLNLLRWGEDVRTWDELELPPAGAMGLAERELDMAGKLVEELSTAFDPADYRDEFREEVMALVERKAKAGETETVTPVEKPEGGGSSGAQIIDLGELLRRSLRGGGKGGKPDKGGTKRSDADDDKKDEDETGASADDADAPASKRSTSRAKRSTSSTRKQASTTGTRSAAKTARRATAKPKARRASAEGSRKAA